MAVLVALVALALFSRVDAQDSRLVSLRNRVASLVTSEEVKDALGDKLEELQERRTVRQRCFAKDLCVYFCYPGLWDC